MNTHTGPDLNVNFVISNLLGPDTNVNESRLMVLEHLVQLWGASVRPNSVVTHAQVMDASTADMQVAGASAADMQVAAADMQVAGASAADVLLAQSVPHTAVCAEVSDDAVAEQHASEWPISYALGRFNYTDVWYVVKELRRRDKDPQIQVKFLSRLDGSTGSTLLPSPSTDWVMHITTRKPNVSMGGEMM